MCDFIGVVADTNLVETLAERLEPLGANKIDPRTESTPSIAVSRAMNLKSERSLMSRSNGPVPSSAQEAQEQMPVIGRSRYR